MLVAEGAVAAQDEIATLRLLAEHRRQAVALEVEIVVEDASRARGELLDRSASIHLRRVSHREGRPTARPGERRTEENRHQYGEPGDGRTTLQTCPYCHHNAIPCYVVVVVDCVSRIVAKHGDR